MNLALPATGQGNAVDVIADWLAALAQPIFGLKLEWLSSSSIKVKTGAATIPSGGLMTVETDITVTGISLGNNAWGHVYLYNNSGSPAVEVVTTAPSNYFGTAYQKTGASSRRYLGSVKTGASGNIFSFLMQGDRVLYREQLSAAPFRVLNGGAATSETTVNCGTAGTNAGAVPVTSRIAVLRITNTSTTQFPLTGTSDDNTANLIRDVYVEQVGETPLDASQALTYKYPASPGGGVLYIDVVGYRFER